MCWRVGGRPRGLERARAEPSGVSASAVRTDNVDLSRLAMKALLTMDMSIMPLLLPVHTRQHSCLEASTVRLYRHQLCKNISVAPRALDLNSLNDSGAVSSERPTNPQTQATPVPLGGPNLEPAYTRFTMELQWADDRAEMGCLKSVGFSQIDV